MRITPANSLLLIVDLQARLLPAIDGHDAVMESAHWLLGVAETLGVPVLLTEQNPAGLGSTPADLRKRVPAERILEKIHFSAVAEGNLLPAAGGRRQWVVIGTEAHVCVQQTVLDLLDAGQTVFVVEDGVGSRHANDKALALARMRQNGAEIVSREMVAFEWLERAGTAQFRDVLKRFIR